MSFDPDAYLAGGATTFNPDAYLNARPSAEVQNPPVLAGRQDWSNLYGGLEGLDSRLTPPQVAAFSSLDRTSDNPQEARARVINQSYLGDQLKGLDSAALRNNWQSVKDTYAKQSLGLDEKGITDSALYAKIGERIKAEDFAKKKEFSDASPWGRFEMVMKAFPAHFFPTTEKTLGEMGQGAERSGQPFVELPEAPKDLPDIPALGISNPALLGGIYNKAIKPFVEGVESPLGVGTLGVGSELAALGKTYPAAKAALSAMSGVFAGLMLKRTVETTPNAIRTINDPQASFQDKVEAVAEPVSQGIMALGGALGAVEAVRPKALNGLEGKTPAQASDLLNQEAAKLPLDQAEPLTNAAREMAKIAEPIPPQTEIGKGWDEVKKIFAPAARGEGAKIAAGALREHGGELAQRTDQAAAALEDSSKILMRMEPADRWAAVDAIESGAAETEVPTKLKPFAEAVRAILDTKRDEIQALGTGKLEHFIDDYFPHIWKDSEKASDAFRRANAGKAPMEGTKSFLKQRTIPTMREGMALGLEPATSNPVEMVLLRAREMDKYLLGQRWLSEMKEKGLVKFVRSGEKPPEGYTPINDNIATVYGQPSHPGAMQIEGKYMAPSGVATLANNYLTPGLRQYASFRAYLTAANSLNQFQLGLSAFHLGFTSIDTSISKMALALEYGAQGKIGRAAAEAAKVPVAPFSTMIQGNRVLKEWMNPGTQGNEIGQIADAIRTAGGRAKMDNFYQTTITKRMQELFREGGAKGYLGALWRTPLAAMEQASKPMMEYLVPRQKLGVAADLMRLEIEKLPATATQDDMREAFGKVWDSVDNRMGQMVYDNIFWNKTAKDLAMASVRSVGWNLGTLRELGGGVKDAGMGEFSHRAAYAIALPTITGIFGATYQYLRTGEGPQELRDYFFPKTGEKDPQGREVRMTIPTYMKDIYHYGHDPVGTVEGKVHPAISMMIQMLNNKDYFGREIRHSDDPVVKQMLDEAKHFADNFVPIGIRNFETSEAAGRTRAEDAANFLGVTRAPAWVGESSAEQLAGQLAGDKFKSSTSPDSAAVAKRGVIQSELRSGDPAKRDKANAQLDAMVESGELTATQRRNLVRGTDHTYLENAIGHLDANEAMRVFSVASMAERLDIAEAVQKKIAAAHLSAEDKKALGDRFKRLLPTRNITTTNR